MMENHQKSNLRKGVQASTRKIDNMRDQQLLPFRLEIYKDINFVVNEIVKDSCMQKKGIDIIGHFKADKNAVLYIDEKSASKAQYLERQIITFSQELQFIDKGGNIRIGWLLNPSYMTTHYLFCWPHGKNSENGLIAHVSKIEYALVPKKKIHEYLESVWGYSAAELLEATRKELENEIKPRMNRIHLYFLRKRLGQRPKATSCRPHKPALHITYSYTYQEQPINVLIDKAVLMDISIFSGVRNFSQEENKKFLQC